MTCKPYSPFLAIFLLLHGCAQNGAIEGDHAIPGMEEIAAELETLLQTIDTDSRTDPATPVRPQPIRIPRDAPWLGDIVAGTYQAPPVDAIRNLLPGRAIRWELRRPIPDIVVLAPPGGRTASQHLDHIAFQADWAWSQVDGVLVVSDFPTRHYLVSAIPGNLETTIPARAMNSPVSTGASGAGASTLGQGQLQGGEMPENTHTMELNAFEELSDSLAQLLSVDSPGSTITQDLFDTGQQPGFAGAGAQGSYTIIPASNLVVVSAAPSSHALVADLIDQFNAGVNNRVILTITVFELAFSDRNQRSIDLSLLREAAISSGIQITGPEFDLTDPNGLSVDLVAQEGNAYDTSNLLFRLLQTQGSTSVRLHERFEMTNNVPASIADERVLPYVSEISTGNQFGGALSSLTPQIQTQQLNTGISLNVIASITSDRVNVRLGFSQAQLVRFEPYSFGDGASAIAGTLPVTDAQHRLFRMSLEDGDTRLIANVTKTSISDESANNAFGVLGGSRSSDQAESQTIIAVTAQML